MKRADSDESPSRRPHTPSPTKKRKPAKTINAVEAPSASSREKSFSSAQTAEPEIDAVSFRRRLIAWYRLHARVLPWRGTSDPYRIWVSEIMLQQTRVAAVIDHYNEFLRRFPTLVALALAPEADVLAAWSGLGYYRRARMLHKAAHFIMLEREGRFPTTATELRTLPGIGEYTSAAIASIAFAESIAVVDGNVERVLLRLTGRLPEGGAVERAFLQLQAQALIPLKYERTAATRPPAPTPHNAWDATERVAIAAAAHPSTEAGGSDEAHAITTNAAGDHNQAMMELGATICLPRSPLCLQCPVYAMCRTRGEHPTTPRAPQLSRPIAYLLDIRKRGASTEVLLECRPADASLMPDMYELPQLPLDIVEGREPVLRLRHAITQTNYYVQVFAPRRVETSESSGPGNRKRSEAHTLRRAIPAGAGDLHWTRTSRLATLPLTGLTRKILQRLKIMDSARLNILE